jgi:ferredoxin
LNNACANPRRTTESDKNATCFIKFQIRCDAGIAGGHDVAISPPVSRSKRHLVHPPRARDDVAMPKLTVEGAGTFDVPANKRLVNALEDEAKIDQMHACGGNARCTTCRVEFIAGEPQKMTQAEKDILSARGLATQPALRLSCQILCENDMEVRAISRVSTTGRPNAGARPADDITPPPVWTTK